MTALRFSFFIQARLGSTRLPRKVLRPFANGHTLLEMVTNATTACQGADMNTVVLLTTTSTIDNELADAAKSLNLKVFRGSEDNVLKRFYDAAQQYPSDNYMRICCDNPFLQTCFMNELTQSVIANGPADYVTHRSASGKPVIQTSLGLFAELFSDKALKRAYAGSTDAMDLEHVTRYFYSNPEKFSLRFLPIPHELDDKRYRFTLDDQSDFEDADEILGLLSKNGFDTNYENILSVVADAPYILSGMSSRIKRYKKD